MLEAPVRNVEVKEGAHPSDSGGKSEKAALQCPISHLAMGRIVKRKTGLGWKAGLALLPLWLFPTGNSFFISLERRAFRPAS